MGAVRRAKGGGGKGNQEGELVNGKGEHRSGKGSIRLMKHDTVKQYNALRIQTRQNYDNQE